MQQPDVQLTKVIYNTRGIVLNQINYGESSVVTKIYTELFGLQSYIIKGVRSPKAKIKSNMLQPLSLLEMGVYNRDKSSLQHVKFANSVNPTSQIGIDVIKGSLAIFIAEVMYRSVREEEPNPTLFAFILKFIQDLEDRQQIGNHHLIFMLELSMHLGFYPDGSSRSKPYFDKQEGVFADEIPQHGDWMDQESSLCLASLMNVSMEAASNVKMSSAQRNDLVNHLIAYYNLHLDVRIEIKSHKILQAIMQ